MVFIAFEKNEILKRKNIEVIPFVLKCHDCYRVEDTCMNYSLKNYCLKQAP